MPLRRLLFILNARVWFLRCVLAPRLLVSGPSWSLNSAVAHRIHTPYETVRLALNQLEEAGYLASDDGLFVTDERGREAARDLLVASAGVSAPSIEEAYVLPQFGDWPFAFVRIDAVYVWTQGGYQVGRNPDDYPPFLAVRDQEAEAWQDFFEWFGLPAAIERQPRDELNGPPQIVLDPRPTHEVAHVDGSPVVPREETLA